MQRDEGADLVIGCVDILPRMDAEEFCEGLRLDRSAERGSKPIAFNQLRRVDLRVGPAICLEEPPRLRRRRAQRA